MKNYGVNLGFEIIVEANNKEEAIELARKEVNLPGIDLYCDEVKEVDDNYNYNYIDDNEF